MATVETKRAWAAAGILLLLLCGLFWQAIVTPRVMSQADYLMTQAPWREAAPGDGAFVPQNSLLRDQSCQFIPWRKFAVDSIRQGVLPLWNPYSYCGVPFVANDQSAVFYPTMLLYVLLPFHLAALLSALLRLLAAGLGMYGLLRRFEVSFGPAMVAAIAFMGCGSLIVWLNHPHANVTVLLPLLLLLIDRQCAAGGWRNAALLAAVVALQFLGGHIESSLVLAVAGAVFLVGRIAGMRSAGGPTVRRRLAVVTLAVAVGVAAAAVQLLPLAEYLSSSWVVADRGQSAAADGHDNGVWWRAIPTLAMPRLYGDPVDSAVAFPSVYAPRYGLRNFNERSGDYVGIPMLMLGLVGATLAGRRRHAACFLALGAAAFCLAYRVPPFYSLFVAIPGMKLTAVMLSRMQLLVAFALCVLGAFALDRQTRDLPAVRPRAARLMLGAAVTGSVAFGVWSAWFYLGDRPGFERTWSWLRDPGVLPADAAERAAMTIAVSGIVCVVSVAVVAALALWGRHWFGKRLWIAWAVLVALDALSFGYGFNPIVPRERVFPETPTTAFLRENLGPGRIAARDAFPGATTTWYDVRNISGYDAIEVLDYAKILRARSGMSPAVLRALGVRYLVTDPALPAPAGRVVHEGDARIVELPGFVGRANVVPHAVDVGSMRPEHVLTALGDPRFDPTSIVLLDLGGQPPPPGGPGAAIIVEDGVNVVVVEANAPEGGWLVLADTDYAGWRVEVDGRSAPLHRANLAFRAVYLEPGDHRVRFEFRPVSFTVGAGLSLAGWLGIVAMFAVDRRRQRETRKRG